MPSATLPSQCITFSASGSRNTSMNRVPSTIDTTSMIAVAFTEYGVSRVWAQTMTVNARSRRVMEQCGMRYVRTFHQTWDQPLPGSELGEVEYAITREQWLRITGTRLP